MHTHTNPSTPKIQFLLGFRSFYLENVVKWKIVKGVKKKQGHGSQGAVGATFPPPNWKLWGAPPPPQLWTINVVHFYFCLFLLVNLGFS